MHSRPVVLIGLALALALVTISNIIDSTVVDAFSTLTTSGRHRDVRYYNGPVVKSWNYQLQNQRKQFFSLLSASSNENVSAGTTTTTKTKASVVSPVQTPPAEDETSSSSSTPASFSFVSSPMRVYIEDTDAYGIVYNSNYLRMFDRVLLEVLIQQQQQENQDNDKTQLPQSAVVLGEHVACNSDIMEWSLVAVGQQKFMSSPVLGSEVVVHGELVRTVDRISQAEAANATAAASRRRHQLSVWNMEMKSLDGSQTFNVVTNVVLAASRLGGSDDNTVQEIQKILPATAFENNRNDDDTDDDSVDGTVNGLSCHDTFRLQRDELDVHAPQQLPLRTILCYFERGRTNFFGGPKNLRKLQGEGKVMAVVTNVKNLSLVWRK